MVVDLKINLKVSFWKCRKIHPCAHPIKWSSFIADTCNPRSWTVSNILLIVAMEVAGHILTSLQGRRSGIAGGQVPTVHNHSFLMMSNALALTCPLFSDEACRENIHDLLKSKVSVTFHWPPFVTFSVYTKYRLKLMHISNKKEQNRKFNLA